MPAIGDGFFYCFEAGSGALLWYREIGERISYSAAFQTYPEYPQGLVFFAAENSRAYALDAETGLEVWSSDRLPGSTFYGVLAGCRRREGTSGFEFELSHL